MYNSYIAGDLKTARVLHEELYPINKAMFIETNPIPVKTALSMKGFVKPIFRLPLTPMRDKNQILLKQILSEHKVL